MYIYIYIHVQTVRVPSQMVDKRSGNKNALLFVEVSKGTELDG